MFVTASRFVFADGMCGFLFRRPFQANDFDSFLVNPFQVLRLETVQTAGVDVSTHHLFNRLFACFIQIFERTEGMGRQLMESPTIRKVT